MNKTIVISKEKVNLNNIFHSNYYLLFVLTLSICSFAFKFELTGLAILAIILSLNLSFSEDLHSAFVTFMFICIIPLGLYGIKWAEVKHLWWTIVFVVGAFAAHSINHPKKFVYGKQFYAMLAYSIALILGGIGTIPLVNYFDLSTLYYVLALGPLMLLFYIFVYSNIDAKFVDFFAKGMFYIGIMIILMWSVAVIQELPNYTNGFYIPYRQWKNNISNYALLAIPFIFYLSTKNKNSIMYFVFGFLVYFSIVFGQSRGATIMATILLPIMVIYSLHKMNSNNRSKGIFVVVLLTIASIIFFSIFRESIIELFKHNIDKGGSGRIPLYKEAIKNFLAHPFLGVGIGYINDEVYLVKPLSMFWYHSTILQVAASMGIVGLIAYFYQLIVRMKILCKKNIFNIFALFAFIGFEGYSMVNTGDFAPVPFVVILTFLITLCEKNNEQQQINKIELSACLN